MAKRSLCFDCVILIHQVVVVLWLEAPALYGLVLSESVNIIVNSWALCLEIEFLKTSVPWAVLKEDNTFKNWITMEVKHHWLVATAQKVVSI